MEAHFICRALSDLVACLPDLVLVLGVAGVADSRKDLIMSRRLKRIIPEEEVEFVEEYEIDWEQIKTVKDVVVLLQSLGIGRFIMLNAEDYNQHPAKSALKKKEKKQA